MNNPYETPGLISQYLLFHYGKPDEILPYDEAPHSALDFAVRAVKEMVDPRRPSQREVEEHERHHLPYRNWCPVCVKAKGKEMPNHMLFEECANIRTDPFDLEELERFLKKAKNNKSPGPDGMPMEFYKWLNDSMKVEMLKIINKVWNEKWLLEAMEEANVVTLYQKKETLETPRITGPSNCCYRFTNIYE